MRAFFYATGGRFSIPHVFERPWFNSCSGSFCEIDLDVDAVGVLRTELRCGREVRFCIFNDIAGFVR